ncbi:YcxB family protein [Massilia sp. IC2-476]|uniref:YcxB family protein n=1 Tax=Massilia sp. IC2-476 TaxID=2887199 RepID=UPI001D1304BD|nr:YcxB family protein [Massilia sp. IC2-476]MCC2973086.1 YcxB family protein [Massilia sp. IC2-476]
MLSFNHPRPVNSNKPVAALVQEQADDSVLHMSVSDGPADVPVSSAAPALPLSELHFFVRYTLGEYLSFMWEHGGFLIRRRRIRFPASLYLRLKSTLSAALHFIMLGRGRRTYEFTIDQHGIVRTSGGVTLIGWEDVIAVRTYTRGFMMVLKRGTLPLPFRALSEAQTGAMRELAAARRDSLL